MGGGGALPWIHALILVVSISFASCTRAPYPYSLFFQPLVMTTSKISQIVRDIESARCKGQWYAIPELARRYKKYCSSGTGIVFLGDTSNTMHSGSHALLISVLEQTILVEATLAQYIENYQDHDDDQVRVESHQVEPLLQQLESALESANDLTTDAEKEVGACLCMHLMSPSIDQAGIVLPRGNGTLLLRMRRNVKGIGYRRSPVVQKG